MLGLLNISLEFGEIVTLRDMVTSTRNKSAIVRYEVTFWI